MPKNPDLPVLFAKTVLGELTEIRATVKCLSRQVLSDIAGKDPALKDDLVHDFKRDTEAVAAISLDHHLRRLGLDD